LIEVGCSCAIYESGGITYESLFIVSQAARCVAGWLSSTQQNREIPDMQSSIALLE